jgi:hypothetical protein
VEDILREGDPSSSCHLVISGLACRNKILEDGSRQIMAFLVPGSLCDAEVFILREIDHHIGTLAPSLIASIPGDAIRDLLLKRFGIAFCTWVLGYSMGRVATGECGDAGTAPYPAGRYDDSGRHVSAPPPFGIWLLSREHRQGSRGRLPSGRALPEAPVRPATSTLQGEHAKR